MRKRDLYILERNKDIKNNSIKYLNDLGNWFIYEEKEVAEQFFDEYSERFGIKDICDISFVYYLITCNKEITDRGYMLITHNSHPILKFDIMFKDEKPRHINSPLVYSSNMLDELILLLIKESFYKFKTVYETIDKDSVHYCPTILEH